MVKVIAGLGLLLISAYVFLTIHRNALEAKERASIIRRTMFGDYGSYLQDSNGFGILIVLIAVSVFALILIVWGCFFEQRRNRS